MSEQIPLLINPKAGSLFRSGLKAWLDNHQKDFRIINTKSAQNLTDKARELAESGEPIVAAAGGDGTLMCAAQGIIGTKAALGILPCGTMNVFARELGIGSRRFDVALEAMKGTHRQNVDIFTVNGTPFLQLAGFGPDASIVRRITPDMKKWLGAASHIVTGVKVAVEHHPIITLTTPNGEQVCGTQIILGNGKRYGGEGHLFANARYDDGKLDAAIIQMESTGILFEVIAYMLLKGATERNTSDFTQLRQFSSCTISAEGKLDYQLDGDYAGTLLPGEIATIERLPHPLRLCVPPNALPHSHFDRFLRTPIVSTIKKQLLRIKAAAKSTIIGDDEF